MASARTLEVQGLTTNGVAVGGLGTLSFTPEYKNEAASAPEGAAGEEDYDVGGLACGVTLDCSDPKKAASILDATPGNTVFSAHESGLTTFHLYTLTGATKGAIVWSGMRMSAAGLNAMRLSMDGRVRFAASDVTLADLLAVTAGQAKPTLTYPARLIQPHNFSFNPDAGEPITLADMAGIELSLAATQVYEEWADNEGACVSVDRGPFQRLMVTITHADATASAPSHKNAALLAAGLGTLTCDLNGAAGGTEQTLTVNNLRFRRAPQSERAGYSEFQLSGACGWKKSTTTYGLVAAEGPPVITALWTIANKA
jgi:hypothetical protein